MDDTILWSVALGIGVLGLVLVMVAGAAAMAANARARRSRAQAPPVPEPRPRAAAPAPDQLERGGGWLWLKAGVFAFIHAGAVSFVLGGLTFFEDIARANEEIRTTGTVTFPKRLLPKTLAGTEASLPLVHSSSDVLAQGNRQPHSRPSHRSNPGPTMPQERDEDWEVVDVLPEDASESDEEAA